MAEDDDDEVRRWLDANETVLADLEPVPAWDELLDPSLEPAHSSTPGPWERDLPAGWRPPEPTKAESRPRELGAEGPKAPQRKRKLPHADIDALQSRVAELRAENGQLQAAVAAKRKRPMDAFAERLAFAEQKRRQQDEGPSYFARFGTSAASWLGLSRKVERLGEDVKPSLVLQMLLWTLLQDDAFYQGSSSFWAMIREVLEADEGQSEGLVSLRGKARRVATELRAAGAKLAEALALVQTESEGAERTKSALLAVLKPAQLEEFGAHLERCLHRAGARRDLMQVIGGLRLDGLVPPQPQPVLASEQPWGAEKVASASAAAASAAAAAATATATPTPRPTMAESRGER